MALDTYHIRTLDTYCSLSTDADMLESLPKELLHRIVHLLSGEDVAQLLPVSKRVYQCLAGDVVWKPVYMKRWHSDCAVRSLG